MNLKNLIKKTSIFFLLLLSLYMLFWPVPIDPVPWQAPYDKGLTGKFQANDSLSNLEIIMVPDLTGPEDVALSNNEIFASTREGWIIKYNQQTGAVTKWVNTQGSPLGITFDKKNNLIVADAYLGLLKISPNGQISVLTKMVNGDEIRYADDVDVTKSGKIIFSDASTKFSAKFGGTYKASLLDIAEHGGHGRILVYDPSDNTTKVLMDNLNFANGVALDEESNFFLTTETGSYQIHKYWLKGDKAGSSEIIINNLPGFPDNIVRGQNGRFWVGLVSPRSKIIDALSNFPKLRKVVQRLPEFLRPSATYYSHVFALDEDGNVLITLQDPIGKYHTNTGALETDEWLYISSLQSKNLARLSKKYLNFEGKDD